MHFTLLVYYEQVGHLFVPSLFLRSGKIFNLKNHSDWETKYLDKKSYTHMFSNVSGDIVVSRGYFKQQTNACTPEYRYINSYIFICNLFLYNEINILS